MGSGWANPRAPGGGGGTRRVPLHSSVPAKIAFSKMCDFPTLFSRVWLLSAHNDAFHQLMKSESFGCPRCLQLVSRGGGNFTYAFSKRCPFPTPFFIVRLRNSHNDACHKLMKIRNIWVPLQVPRGRNFTYVRYMDQMGRKLGKYHGKSLENGYKV